MPTGFSCTAGVNTCSYALDGSFTVLGQQWQTETAWWTGTADSVTCSLSGPTVVSSLTVSLDNNDSYLIEGSVDGSVWSTLVTALSTDGSVGSGMDTFADLGFLPASLSFVRVSATGGDNLYSVGELTLATAVPEPATWALGLSGLLMLGAIARRRGRTG